MAPRTLWTIILKTFGIYIVLQVYSPLTQLTYFILMVMNHQFGDNGQTFGNAVQAFGFAFFSISIYLFMVIAFLFRTDWIIDKLKLDKSIKEEKLELNVHRSTVLTIIVLLSGILLFVDSLPQFLKELYSYYAVVNSYLHFKDYPRASFIIIQLVKLLISIFMVTSSRLIVNFIERKRKGKLQTEPEAPTET
jgi:hypothetical protein